MSRNLRSDCGANIFKGIWCLGFCLCKIWYKQKELRGEKKVNFFLSDTFSHRMISEAQTLISICALSSLGKCMNITGGVSELNVRISQTQILHRETKRKTSGTAGTSKIASITVLLHSSHACCRVVFLSAIIRLQHSDNSLGKCVGLHCVVSSGLGLILQLFFGFFSFFFSQKGSTSNPYFLLKF